MEDKKINIEGLSMEKVLDQFYPGTIIEKSPAQKINIELDNELFVVGFNLMCENDIKYDLEGLNPNTLIVINQHHMIECLIMIAGAIYCTCKIVNFDIYFEIIIKYIHRIKDRLNCSVTFFSEIHYVADKIGNDLQSNCSKLDESIITKLKTIIEDVWFLPYSEIDKLKEKIKKELGDTNE